MARGIKKIKKEYEGRNQEFERFAKKVTCNYAESKQEYSQDQIAKDFEITVSCVRKLLDYAITNALVSRDVAVQVMEKSIANQQRKHPEAGGTSLRHHKELMKKRDEYIAKSYKPADIQEIVDDVVYESRNLDDVVKRFHIESKIILKKLLERAIVENICSDKETDRIIMRSFKVNQTKSAREYFIKIVQERIKNKKEKDSG